MVRKAVPPLTAGERVRALVSPRRFVVERVVLGLVYLKVIRVSHVSIASPWLSILRSYGG
jgi:hypothetical protein